MRRIYRPKLIYFLQRVVAIRFSQPARFEISCDGIHQRFAIAQARAALFSIIIIYGRSCASIGGNFYRGFFSFTCDDFRRLQFQAHICAIFARR